MKKFAAAAMLAAMLSCAPTASAQVPPVPSAKVNDQTPLAAEGGVYQYSYRGNQTNYCIVGVGAGSPWFASGNTRRVAFSGSVICGTGNMGILIEEVSLRDAGGVNRLTGVIAKGPYWDIPDGRLTAGGEYDRARPEQDVRVYARFRLTTDTDVPSSWTTYNNVGCKRQANPRELVCQVISAPFRFIPPGTPSTLPPLKDIVCPSYEECLPSANDPGYTPDTGADCPGGETPAPPVRAAIARSAAAGVTAPRFTGAASGLYDANVGRRMGELDETIRPSIVRNGSGFTVTRSFGSASFPRVLGDGITLGGTNVTALRAITGAGTKGRLRGGALEFRGIAKGTDLVVRGASLGTQWAFVRRSGARQEIKLAFRPGPGERVRRLPNGLVVVTTDDKLPLPKANGARLRGAELTGAALRDPRAQQRLAEAALNEALLQTGGTKPNVVLVPPSDGRFSVAGDEVTLVLDRVAGTRTARAAAATNVSMMQAADPSDVIDDQDATEPGNSCFVARDDNAPAVANAAATREAGPKARAAQFPFPKFDIPCLGRAQKAIGIGGGGIEVRAQVACTDRKSRSLSAQACLAVKRYGISIGSIYRDLSCPMQGVVNFGRFAGQTHVASCQAGNHKYKTHAYVSVNGRKTNAYQSGRLHIKRCGS